LREKDVEMKIWGVSEEKETWVLLKIIVDILMREIILNYANKLEIQKEKSYRLRFESTK
jgi:hypothetical protein